MKSKNSRQSYSEATGSVASSGRTPTCSRSTRTSDTRTRSGRSVSGTSYRTPTIPPSFASTDAVQPDPENEVEVTVISARNLEERAVDPSDDKMVRKKAIFKARGIEIIDPYVTVEISPGPGQEGIDPIKPKRRRRTLTVQNSRNPKWWETFKFGPTHQDIEYIRLNVWDENCGQDTLLGFSLVRDIAELWNSGEKKLSLQLYKLPTLPGVELYEYEEEHLVKADGTITIMIKAKNNLPDKYAEPELPTKGDIMGDGGRKLLVNVNHTREELETWTKMELWTYLGGEGRVLDGRGEGRMIRNGRYRGGKRKPRGVTGLEVDLWKEVTNIEGERERHGKFRTKREIIDRILKEEQLLLPEVPPRVKEGHFVVANRDSKVEDSLGRRQFSKGDRGVVRDVTKNGRVYIDFYNGREFKFKDEPHLRRYLGVPKLLTPGTEIEYILDLTKQGGEKTVYTYRVGEYYRARNPVYRNGPGAGSLSILAARNATTNGTGNTVCAQGDRYECTLLQKNGVAARERVIDNPDILVLDADKKVGFDQGGNYFTYRVKSKRQLHAEGKI